MTTRSYTPLIDAFLIVEQPRQRLSHWSQALAPLDDGRAPPLASVTAYYDPASDEALIGVRYDELALGAEKLAFVVEIALLAEIGMIQPAELTDGDRRRFLGERLARCSVHVTDQRTAVGALTELVRFLREQKPASKPARLGSTPPAPPQTAAARGSLVPRGVTREALSVQPKSTRDDLPPHLQASSSAPHQPPMPSRTEYSRHVVARPRPVHRARTVEVPSVEAQRLVAKSLRDSGGSPTVPAAGALSGHLVPSLTPAVTVVAVKGLRPPAPIPRLRSVAVPAAEPYLPTMAGPQLPGVIYARYLRSGRWVPVRIGALSLKGAALLSGALPRLHDRVDVALTYGEHRALVRGAVAKVSTAEETLLSGTASFSVKFELDDTARRQLVSLLTAARGANVTIKPPPPRQARRLPVEWPVCLGTMRGAVRAEALDVSRDGMFVRPIHALSLDTKVNFSCVIDDGPSPISGRARVVRHITAATAAACGLVAGYGLQITDMSDLDRARWLEFLTRIERRADKRVLVGAAPGRLAELQAALAAAGYAVTGGTDPGALEELAASEPRPVDAALIDASFIHSGQPPTWAESLFADRNVPCVTMHGDVRRARVVMDKLLAV